MDDLAECTILLVDDEEANLALLEMVLRPVGYERLVRVADARDVMAAFERSRPDIVLLDLHMPHRSGLDLLADIRARVPEGEFLPVLVLTADTTREARERALAEGAHDFVLKPFDRTEVRLRVRNLLRTRMLHVDNARLYAAAQAAVAARERTLAVVAHDLRSPLTAMRFDVEMLRAESALAMSPHDVATLARVERTVLHMDELIEDLLDVSRLERGPLALDRTAVEAGALLADTASSLRSLVEGQGLRFDVQGDAAIAVMEVDRRRIVQAVSNLVGNAAKFASDGGLVSMSWARTDGEVRIAVRDDGAGIPPDELQHIFGAFWQARHADRRGLGLGLAIARGIVEAHGGRIWAESTVGTGTTFVIALPAS